MSWQTIAASETDANSPLNQTLMDKIRGDINHLAENALLVCMEKEESASVPGYNWTTVKQGMMYVPSFAATLSAKVECYVATAASDKAIRIKVENGSGGYNYSDQQPPNTGSYDYETLTIPGSGSFAGAGGWRKFWIEARHTESANRTFYVRTALVKTASI